MNDEARDIEAINALLASHVKAVNSSDIAANLRGFTEDVVYLPPEAPPVLGKPALAAFVESFYSAFSAEIEMIPEDTVVSGDWAFQWGNLTGEVWPLKGGDGSQMDWKWLYIYQRQPDGSWKVARDIYNSNGPSVEGS